VQDILIGTQRGTERTLEHAHGAVHVIDLLFAGDFVEEFAGVLLKLPYSLSDHDNDRTQHIRHLIANFEPKILMSGLPIDLGHGRHEPAPRRADYFLSTVALTAAECLRAMYPEYPTFEARRIYANSLEYGAHLTNHTDNVVPGSRTVLYFGNAYWSSEWGGELIICDAHGESLYAIEPRPGRLVLFPSTITHRAGAPNRACYEQRLTVVHKFFGRLH
jgi:hypothetical protein